jgi:hypothetical protein
MATPLGELPTTLATFTYEPALVRTWLHVYVVELPGASAAVPGPPASVL